MNWSVTGEEVSTVFLGTYTPKLDDKGRFFLPAKFREQLASGLVITRLQDRALGIYPMATFQQMTAQIAAAPATVKGVRDFQRMLASGASDEVADKQGRVSIPQALRDYAGLDKEIAVVGALERVEVWDAATWLTYSTSQEETFADINTDLLGGLPL